MSIDGEEEPLPFNLSATDKAHLSSDVNPEALERLLRALTPALRAGVLKLFLGPASSAVSEAVPTRMRIEGRLRDARVTIDSDTIRGLHFNDPALDRMLRAVFRSSK